MLDITAAVLGGLVVVLTALPLIRHKAWWIRVWEFPRVQILLVGLLAMALWVAGRGWADGAWQLALGALLAAAVLWQGGHVWRYSRLAPVEVKRSESDDHARRLALVVSNVLESNRESEMLLGVVRAADPDLLLFVETDDWWRERLDVLAETHPNTVLRPIGNTYGMLLYSRLPLEDVRVDFLIQDDVPSFQAQVVLRDGTRVWLNCVHPRPPAPGESDDSVPRDAELLLVGKRVRGAKRPVVVCGDLNDVAWSRSTRLFQKVSQLVDPRKGRGLYSTFHARWPGLRWPLDHVFFSPDFRLVSMRRLGGTGSDHFPVCVVLSHEPSAEAEQAPPEADAQDMQEASETIQEAR